jgi:FkbM family methyltransferase
MGLLHELKRKVGKKLRRVILVSRRKYDIWKYAGYEPGRIFKITVDDLDFKMTFKGYKLDFTIIERIEGRREPVTTALIQSLVTKGKKVLQIGGGYGYFAAIMSHCTGSKGRVVSIEGTPNTFEILKENIKLNGLANVEAYNLFIAAENGSILFGKDERNSYAAFARLQKGIRLCVESVVSVPLKRLTDFMEEIHFFPDLIFMDIEGSEMDVFEDFRAQGYLKINRPIIVFELHPLAYKQGRDMVFIREFLKANNYYARRADANLICFPE